MKKMMVVIISLIFAAHAFGQQKDQISGIVTYNEVSKIQINIEGDASQFSQMLPKEIKTEKELLFNNEASVYRKKEAEAELEDMMGGNEDGIKIMMGQSNDILYTDLTNNKTVEQKDFMSRKFLITGDNTKHPWKITGEQKTILNYPCMEAVMEEDSMIVKAWFASSIPVSAGPGAYYGLPGLVLEVDIDNGERTIKAESLNLKDLNKDDLLKPKKGKKVSSAEFDKIVTEKMKEQGGEAGGDHVIMIEISQ